MSVRCGGLDNAVGLRSLGTWLKMRKEQREGTQTHYIPILTARPGLSAVLN